MAMISDTLALAVRHHRAGNLTSAEGMYREVLRAHPNHPDALHLLGVLAKQTGRAELAIESIAKAVELNVRDPAFYFNLGNALRDRGRLDQAASHYRRAVELDATFAKAHLNLGAVLHHQGHLDEALASIDRGLALQPHDAQSRRLRSLILLARGDFPAGWREYEWRRQSAPGAMYSQLNAAFWNGESLLGKRILIEPEPGLNDQLMFASCLPDLLALADKVAIGCDARLAVLLSRSFPTALVCNAAVLARTGGRGVAPVDLRIAAGSIPRYLRSGLESFPRHAGYLRPDPRLRQQWWGRFAALGEGLKVGISWRGGVEGGASDRSTTLEQWSRVLRLSDITFVNLQPGDCLAELAAARAQLEATIHHWPEMLSADLDQQAAMIAALDLVITVPNTTSHLAGGLGVPVWNLLAHSCSWRWLLDREDSPWYPSMRLFRQTRPGAWDGVFERIERKLQLAGSLL